MIRAGLFLLILSTLPFAATPAKPKHSANDTSYYCTIDVTTHPAAASIYLNKEEIGASPAEYNLAEPGYAVIRIQKENYYPWDTTLTFQRGQKLKLNIPLQEKTIFSDAGEVNFSRIVAKDTTVEGYRNRIDKVKGRIAQIEYEIRDIFKKFPDTYPVLEPIKPTETLQVYERRKASWQTEGDRQVRTLMNKYTAYKAKLERTIETLEGNIAAATKPATEQHPAAPIKK